MFEKIKKSGWFEEADHTGKAPDHQRVAMQGKYKGTLREAIQPPENKSEKEQIHIQCPKKHWFTITEAELNSVGKNIECSECKKTYPARDWRGVEDPDGGEE